MKKNNNVYKARYKVAFQAKSKIWAYKNSRLRHFFSIRGRKLFRGGFFRKNVLVATTLKWTVARRFIKPYSRRIRARRGKSLYRNTFYLKQQLRHFYGKLTEVAFRSIYKTHLLNTLDRNKSFFGSLEQRADMFLFRMRLLPTIYACNQFVHHQGLLMNNSRIEKCPSALIKIGYTISLPKIYWNSMSRYMIYRVYYRVYGKLLLKKRLYTGLKKKIHWLSVKKFKRRKNFFFRWQKWLQVIKMLTQFWKIFRNLTLFSVKLHEGILMVYKDNPTIFNLYIELLLYKKNLMLKVHRFLFNYKLFLNNIAKYDLKAKIKKKFKNSPRLFILILMHNYALLREFKYIVNYFKEKYLLFQSLVGLEELKAMGNTCSVLKILAVESKSDFKLNKKKTKYYKYLIKKYNLNIFDLFGEKVIPYEQLVTYLDERWTEIVTNYSTVTEEYYHIIEENKYLYHHLYLRSLIKKYILRWKHYYDKIKKKKVRRPRPLAYFLINRKYKKRRRLYISRFKKIHWYIPSYIYFDVRTLRGTLLYVPRANEIVHPFKCSLFKIFSFYKSLGV